MALKKGHCALIEHADSMRRKCSAGDAEKLAFFAEGMAHLVDELLARTCHGE